jgi:hypothetical protein
MLMAWVVLVWWLLGCYQEPSSSSPPSAITESSIIVFNETDEAINLPPQETLDRWWAETQQCIGLTAEAPNVIITKNVRETCPQSTGSQGHYCLINDDWYVVLLWDRLSWGWLWKHEFIHHIKRLNEVADIDHQPEKDWRCQWN